MTITEYYSNYATNKQYAPSLFHGSSITIDGFYADCISKHIADSAYIANALEWHKMLMEYVEEKDAIFWVRYHENGPKNKITGRYQTRRACKTVFNDGFSYVFVSNYDAHEIFNMVRLGVKPDLNEFKNLMQNHEFPLHYDEGKSCEESDICTYPHVGNVKGGVLTYGKWYLAHIIGVKSDIYVNTATKEQYTINTERLYPRGSLSDWQKEMSPCGKDIIVRRINDTLSLDEKAVIKAHFLRFVDPLNYYIVPGVKYQNNKYGKQIGESEYLNIYMRDKYAGIYKAEYKSFENKVLAPSKDEIYITYNPPSLAKKKNKTPNPKAPAVKSLAYKIDLAKISEPYLKQFKEGEIAAQVLGAILKSGKVSKTEIDQFKDAATTKAIFGFGKPLLSPTRKDAKGYNRYYDEPFALYGEILYLYSQWLNGHKERLINWIIQWIAKNGSIV